MLKKIKKYDFHLFFLLNFSLITSLPSLINLTLVMISVFVFISIKLKSLKKIEPILFFFLFCVIVLSTFSSSLSFDDKISSLSWLKMLFLFIFIFSFVYHSLEKKSFLKVSRFLLYFIYFLIIDVFLQRFLNFEFFGNEIIIGRITGPYSEKLIIGGIILYIGFVPFFLKLQEYLEKKKFYKSLILTNLYFLSIFLTGERMNTILSILAIFLLSIFIINHRRFIFSFLIIYFFSIFLISSNYEYGEEKYFQIRYESFLFQISKTDTFCGTIEKGSARYSSCRADNPVVEKKIKEENKKTIFDNTWGAHFLTAIEIWKDNKFFGAGNKSFRYECSKYDNIKSKKKNYRCSTHPHNIYLEILSEFGLTGFILFLYLILIIFYKSLKNIIFMTKNKFFIKKNNFEYWLFFSVFIIFIIIIWPIKSTGRISSTFYGPMFWIYIFFLCGLNYRIQKILFRIN